MTFEKSKLGAKGLLVALFLTALLAPAAQALDDDVSRTFLYTGAPRFTHGGVRAGWYDASGSNACLVALQSIQVPIGGIDYYDSLRVTTNVNQVIGPVGASVIIPIPCPAVTNPRCDALAGCALRIDPIFVRGGTLVYQDALLCTGSSFVDCMPMSAQWIVSTCPWASASFTTRADPNQGFLGGTGLANVLLAQDINCTSYTTPSDRSAQILTMDRNHVSSLTTFRVYANGPGGFGMPKDFVDVGGGVSSSGVGMVTGGIGAFAVATEVPPGSGTRYVVSCLSVTRTVIDSNVIPPTITSATQDSVDWFLVLDAMENPFNWANALVKHVAGTGSNGNLALQGIYDHGGDNDCDFSPGGSVVKPLDPR